MTIGKKFFLFFSILFLLVALLSVCLWAMLNNANQLAETQVRRFESYKLAEELRRSSDDLTRMARTYTVTGDVRFKHYFETIAAIRDGKEPRPKGYQNIFWDLVTGNHQLNPIVTRNISLVSLMQELAFSDDELAALIKAKERSDNLINMEVQAFNAMDGRFLDDTGAYSLKGEPDWGMARRLVHGRAYHQAKARIMEAVSEFFTLLELRTLNEVIIQKAAQERAYIFSIILSLLLVMTCLYGYYYFNKDIVYPLNDMREKIKQIQAGEYAFKDVTRNDEIGLLMNAFVGMSNIISTTIDKLEHTSRTDQLTNINNRIALNEMLEQEKYKFDRYNTCCSLMLIDVDNFKEINDKYGHTIGDKVLVEIANVMKSNMRDSDVIGRWGGEEFLIICPNTNLEDVRRVASAIRKRIESFTFSSVGRRTASFGTSTFTEAHDLVATIDAADTALYKAKEHGRNRVF